MSYLSNKSYSVFEWCKVLLFSRKYKKQALKVGKETIVFVVDQGNGREEETLPFLWSNKY